MIKVTLLGDSIRAIGYGKMVPELLGSDFEVFQPEENCRFAKYTLRGIFDWKEQMEGTNIVHWNNGLWDICNLFGDGAFSSEEEYISNILRIADILLNKYDKVIFATTTPVRPENQYDSNKLIERYNQIIVPKLREKGVIINDLHSLVSTDVYRYISQDTIHLTEEGIKLCAEQVAMIIKNTANTLPFVSENKNTDYKSDNKSLGLPV
ncbi:MAG: SGNH/GDSL hydrolase family protein [Clostridia bacterium]|nr:SGNH/GDSL hydrolase family protein [Clostridia bacterium]